MHAGTPLMSALSSILSRIVLKKNKKCNSEICQNGQENPATVYTIYKSLELNILCYVFLFSEISLIAGYYR